jgi:CBS-domain-containing membrane protein
MKAAEVMSTEPDVLRPNDTLEYAAETIMRSRYRSMPVVDEDGCYLGMFDVNCLLKHVIPKAVFMPQGLRNVSFIHESFEDLFERYSQVKDEPVTICLSHEVHPLNPDTPLTETLLQLYHTHLSIPVVAEGSCKLLGMISYFDVGRKILAVGHLNDD